MFLLNITSIEKLKSMRLSAIRLWIFFTLTFSLVPASAVEILSKDDTKRVFATTFSDWKRNLAEFQKHGSAELAIASKYEYSMIANTRDGQLLVTPSYRQGSLAVPYRITVTVVSTGMVHKLISELPDTEVLEMINGWHTQMQPEYQTFSTVEIFPNDVRTTFLIFQSGADASIDKASAESNGCWESCIKRAVN